MVLRALAGLLTTATLATAQAASTSPAPAPGVPRDLATRRAATLRDLRYDLTLAIPDRPDQRLRGTMRLTLGRRGTDPLVLDFDAGAESIRAVEVNERCPGTAAITPLTGWPADRLPLPDGIRWQAGHLIIAPTCLHDGLNEVRIRFEAGDAPLNRAPDFLYTLFVPARARQAIPVIDQPDLKARLALTLELPADWRAIANGDPTAEERGVDAEGTPRVRLRFRETEPIPTYLMAFAAGRLQVDSAHRAGRWIRMFHRETDSARVARNRDAIYDLHAQSLAFMQEYTGIDYPFGKFDIFLAPAFQFGGMEHPGAIFYNAGALMLDTTATQAQRLGRASVIAHETAHMWFGDLVTMQWFNDVWLKEVFANFFAARIVNPAFPGVNHELRFLLAHYPSAYDVDRTAGANPIQQPLDNLAEAGSLYGPIIYQKAPIMMRQLEFLLGDQPFRDGLREYLRRHAFGNATWDDLVGILDTRTPADVRAWSRAWVSAPGRPTLAVQRSPGTAIISQRDPRTRGLTWPQRIGVAFLPGDSVHTATLDRNPLRIPIPAGTRAILPTGNGLAYGSIVLDSESRQWLLDSLPQVRTPLQRGSALVTLWEEMVDGRITPAAMRRTLMAMLATESDELLVQRTLGYYETLWTRWLPATDRATLAADAEATLRAGIERAPTTSVRLAWFRTLIRTSQAPATLTWLHDVWRRTTTIPGLTLGEEDETALALQLAVRGVPEWRAMLDSQAVRIRNPDRQGRFAFVRPAVSAAKGDREQWFAGLARLENRRREPWVLDGLSLLHHPLRAEESAVLVPPALAMLEEIQRTGDIFFPKRWLDATLGGHRAPAVAAQVREYLRTRPTLAPRLRAIVQQSADDLWRITAAR